MKTEKGILDEFGKILIEQSFDNQYRFILNTKEDLAETEGYKNLFSQMSDIQKREIENYTFEVLKGTLFDFLRIFEEYTQFKLYYEDNDKKIDLNQISESLKAEPIIENGWIDRFSSEKQNDGFKSEE
jgi:hypothetical protein